MYQASNTFHTKAMDDHVKTDILMQFEDGTFFTKFNDVKDIEVTYPLNEETDVTVGKCVSAELKTTILNKHGLLNGFTFGKCKVSLGTLIGTDTWSGSGLSVVYGYGTESAVTITANATAPYLSGVTGDQPTFAPSCLVIVNNTLYAGDGTNLWAATIDGTTLTTKAVDNDFLAYKLGKWSGKGISYQGNMAYEFADAVNKYEYVPLGTFYFDTPEQRRVANISCEALDGMQKFNVDADDWWAGLAWPMTRGELLASLCAFVGVTLGTATFLGSDTSIPSAPIAGNGLTGKDVLGWIAESAGSYARMSRAGALELVWFTARDVTLSRNQHFGDAPAEYTTPAITALHVMVMNSDLGVVVPDEPGDNEYQIMDNPLLYGSTEADIKPLLTPIYDRLAAFAAYTPNSVEAVCDWALEAGDIIQVTGGDGETRTLPIFRMVLRWAGGGVRAIYECTGGTGRKPAPSAKRKEFALYRAYHKLEVDITGIHSEIGDVKGNVANLEITAGQLQTTVAGKIDGTEAQSLITQTVEKISLEVSSGSGGSSFVLKSDGVAISSQKVDLHVNALNVDGEIVANAINLSTARIDGTLSAAYIDVDSITVKNANIESLYASKIIGGSLGGYIASGAISDAGKLLSDLYVSKADIYELWSPKLHLGSRGSSASTTLTEFSVTTPRGSRTWDDIVAGDSGGAVFG